MFYLFMQTLFWIIAAFVLGLIVGWWLSGRCKCEQQEAAPVVPAPMPEPEPEPEPEPAPEPTAKPQGFTAPPADKDDLKRIKGVGPVIEKTLNGLGIYTFAQISEFTDDNVSWVEEHISFPGRITREQWVSQATDLAAGKATAFSDRVDKGDVSY